MFSFVHKHENSNIFGYLLFNAFNRHFHLRKCFDGLFRIVFLFLFSKRISGLISMVFEFIFEVNIDEN